MWLRQWNQCTFLSLDHFSSVIFRHHIVYLQLQGRIVNSLYHVSRLKLISAIASHRQGDGLYQIPRSCQSAALSPEASEICLFILQKTLWSDTGGEDPNIMLCLILWARRQSWLQLLILFWSAELVPVCTLCPYSVIRASHCYCIPLL